MDQVKPGQFFKYVVQLWISIQSMAQDLEGIAWAFTYTSEVQGIVMVLLCMSWPYVYLDIKHSFFLPKGTHIFVVYSLVSCQFRYLLPFIKTKANIFFSLSGWYSLLNFSSCNSFFSTTLTCSFGKSVQEDSVPFPEDDCVPPPVWGQRLPGGQVHVFQHGQAWVLFIFWCERTASSRNIFYGLHKCNRPFNRDL